MSCLCSRELPLTVSSPISGSPFKITVTEHEDKVFVNCNTTVTHLSGTVEKWLEKNKTLNLGKGILDPRGVYTCSWTEELAKEVPTVQVYYRSTCSWTHRDQIMGPAQVGTFWLKADCGEPICKGHSWWYEPDVAGVLQSWGEFN